MFLAILIVAQFFLNRMRKKYFKCISPEIYKKKKNFLVDNKTEYKLYIATIWKNYNSITHLI